jgi:hypothetical protein
MKWNQEHNPEIGVVRQYLPTVDTIKHIRSTHKTYRNKFKEYTVACQTSL